MKNMILVLALSFLALDAFAGARAFRVNRHSADSQGYAIGWGVNGGNTDFESIDKLPSEEIESFIENNDVRNYLVDLTTNQILLDLSGTHGDILELEAGDIHWGNHFRISIGETAHFYAEGREIVPVIHHFKWFSNITHALVTKRSAAGVQVLKDDQQLEERMLATVMAKLTPSQKTKFKKGSSTISVEYGKDNDGSTDVTWTSEVPKSINDPLITVKAKVEFRLDDNDNILVKVIKVSYKESKY